MTKTAECRPATPEREQPPTRSQSGCYKRLQLSWKLYVRKQSEAQLPFGVEARCKVLEQPVGKTKMRMAGKTQCCKASHWSTVLLAHSDS
jgi:hypothetical protein